MELSDLKKYLPQKKVTDRDNLAVELSKIVGSAYVIEDETGRRAFETDGLSLRSGMPRLVVLPRTSQEISAILKLASQMNCPVVPRGAGTSLCGGAVPSENALVVCLSRMNKILEIDTDNRCAVVEAGVTNIAITKAVEHLGFFYAPDPSSQIACTIAGNIAMNSGGAHCLKYGVTTHNLLGVTMVLISGEIITIGGPFLETAGYDLLALITGSEGQLGIVTEATVKLTPSPVGARPVLLGFASSSDAGECVAEIIANGIVPVAIEFMDRPAIEICETYAKAGYPDNVEALLIVEVEGDEEEIDHQLEKIVRIARRGNLSTYRMSESAAESALIWKGRKAAFGAVGQISDYVCMDGVIPLGKLSLVLPKITEICGSYGFKVANIFHAGDGNLHPLILYDANKAGDIEKVERCGAEILRLCVRAGGCLTGEHGVGLEKRDLMDAQFSIEDLNGQMRIKSVFDPLWLLNRDKVFPLDIRDTYLADELGAEQGEPSL